LKYAYKHTPAFLFLAFFYPAFHAAVIYVEHTLGIMFVTDAIQFGKPFADVVLLISVIALLVLIAVALGRVYYHVLQPKGLEKLNLKIKEELYAKAARTDLACYDDPDYYNEFVLSVGEVQRRAGETNDYVNKISSNITTVIFVSGFFLLQDRVGM